MWPREQHRGKISTGASLTYAENARGTRADAAEGSVVDPFEGIVCAVYTAAGALRLRGGPAPGARRDRSWSDSSAGPTGIGSADWSIFIDQWLYRSMTQCREKGLP